MCWRIPVLCVALYIASSTCAAADDNGLTTVDGVPLYIDGTQTKTVPPKLSPSLLDQVKNVTTLGDALRILGPAYIAPDDSLHIPHYHFQNGFMLTVWPQGGEALADTVTVYPRKDCGMPADACTDLILGRKSGQAKKRQHGGSGGSGGGGGGGGMSSPLSPLMRMFQGR